ncbi:hypothetical protein DQ04_02681110 [Trypanosoma grayi]|uniref:hypothetical protein n=1 Tax=Trypanosoma grayi TaxID=71804 RepID=UPI0004F42E36|nr:hypothetical protein DQ04_02681110 [Trypanosoma grayi]KEG11388.1 hypothetical protein DQ04_02681110 [Trypanosoma grayi]
MRLAEAEMRALSKQQRLLERFAAQSTAERRTSAAERRHCALNRREELLQQLRLLRNGDASSLSPADRARQWSAIYSELAQRREKLSHILSCPSTAVQRANVADAADSWAPFAAATRHFIASLAKAEQPDAPVSPSRALNTQLEQVAKMQLQATSLLSRERLAARLLREDMTDLFKDQAKLLAWCNEQRGAMEGLVTLEDMREFCNSFVSNVAVMDTNFLVLLERSELLGSNRTVREALVEVNNAWMELAVATYRKMRQMLRDEHTASGLEATCKWWLETFDTRLTQILTEARAISSHPEMAAEPLMQGLHERSAALLKELGRPRTLLQHISDFTVREDCVAPHEGGLEGAVLTRLSVLTQTFVGDVRYDGRREYMDRLREVGDWLNAHTTGSGYTQLMKRVKQLRYLAEEQLRALPDGDRVVPVHS